MVVCIHSAILQLSLTRRGKIRMDGVGIVLYLNSISSPGSLKAQIPLVGDALLIYIIKEKLETLSAMESNLPTSDRHAASWIFSDGPSKQLGVVKLRYNALKLFFYNVAILRQRACLRQRLSLAVVSHAGKQLRNSFDVR